MTSALKNIRISLIAIATVLLFSAPFSAAAMHPQSIGDDCDYVYGCDYNHGYITPSPGGYDDYCDDYWYPCYDDCYDCDDYYFDDYAYDPYYSGDWMNFAMSYAPVYQPVYQSQSAYQPQYGYNQYGYTQQASAYIPATSGYPTGDTDTFGSPLCMWAGYDGRASCDSNPRQPIYDPWTGRWY